MHGDLVEGLLCTLAKCSTGLHCAMDLRSRIDIDPLGLQLGRFHRSPVV